MILPYRIRIRWYLLVFKIKRIVARWYGTRRLDYPHHPLVISTQTIREFDVRARSVGKEPETVAWIETESAHGGVLFDIGANVGAYSLIAAARGLRVVAFEPAPQNFAVLHENILLNHYDSVITAVPCVLGEASGEATFVLHDYTRGATEGFFAEQQGSGVQKRFIVDTLDACIERYRLPSPSLVKIDVDGGELEVLRGASRLLTAASVRSILIEVAEDHREEVETILRPHGFTLDTRFARFQRGVENRIYSRHNH